MEIGTKWPSLFVVIIIADKHNHTDELINIFDYNKHNYCPANVKWDG